MEEIWSLHSHPVFDCVLYPAFHTKQHSESSKTSVLAPDTGEADFPLSGHAINPMYTSCTCSCVGKFFCLVSRLFFCIIVCGFFLHTCTLKCLLESLYILFIFRTDPISHVFSPLGAHPISLFFFFFLLAMQSTTDLHLP